MPSNSELHLASRFQAVRAQKELQEQAESVSKMSIQELQEQTIKFGEAKLGQTYRKVVESDPRYCQWFLKKYGNSPKATHQEFVTFLSLWIERQELEQGTTPFTLPNSKVNGPHAGAKSKSSAKPKAKPNHPMPEEEVFEEDDFSQWEDDISVVGSQVTIENQNAERLDKMENLMSQVLQQLQVLTNLSGASNSN